MPSHYHQCPKCGHIWSCDCQRDGFKIRIKDDRCEFGYSTGNSKIAARYNGQQVHKFGRRYKVKAKVW